MGEVQDRRSKCGSAQARPIRCWGRKPACFAGGVVLSRQRRWRQLVRPASNSPSVSPLLLQQRGAQYEPVSGCPRGGGRHPRPRGSYGFPSSSLWRRAALIPRSPAQAAGRPGFCGRSDSLRLAAAPTDATGSSIGSMTPPRPMARATRRALSREKRQVPIVPLRCPLPADRVVGLELLKGFASARHHHHPLGPGGHGGTRADKQDAQDKHSRSHPPRHLAGACGTTSIQPRGHCGTYG
jgi:hypothetical protein